MRSRRAASPEFCGGSPALEWSGADSRQECRRRRVAAINSKSRRGRASIAGRQGRRGPGRGRQRIRVVTCPASVHYDGLRRHGRHWASTPERFAANAVRCCRISSPSAGSSSCCKRDLLDRALNCRRDDHGWRLRILGRTEERRERCLAGPAQGNSARARNRPQQQNVQHEAGRRGGDRRPRRRGQHISATSSPPATARRKSVTATASDTSCDPLPQPAESLPRIDLPAGAPFVITGGARGVTAVVAPRTWDSASV